MTLKYIIAVGDDGEAAISIFTGGEPVTIDQEHPNFSRISAALTAGEDPSPLLNIEQQIYELDARVSIKGDIVYFDGEPTHNKLTQTILRHFSEGRDTAGLVRFMERLAQNPSKRGREVIFEWISDRDLTITPQGTFIGWKGVQSDFTSVFSGNAFVDDVPHVGHIPNAVGSIVSMPRTEEMDDPSRECHVGLHVGTFKYASSFGGADNVLLEVEVAPEDVVSVPASTSSWKIRTCRYKVLKVHANKQDETFENEYEAPGYAEQDPGLDPLAAVVPQSFLSALRLKWKKNRNNTEDDV